MSLPSDTFLTGANIDFIEAMYARYLESPQSIDRSWQAYFSGIGNQGRPLVTDGFTLAARNGAGRRAATATDPLASHTTAALQSRVYRMVNAFRLRGHLIANLDPLRVPRPPPLDDRGLSTTFTTEELGTDVDSVGVVDTPRAAIRTIADRLRRTYARSIGVEYANMYVVERRRWLQKRMESSENATQFSIEERRRILTSLYDAEAFETTIHTKFQGQKRFSAEGGETQIPMLIEFLETGARLGVEEVVIGMAHRGRLNVLCNVLGKPAEEIFSEISGPLDPSQYLNRSDVKYHMGYSREWVGLSGKSIHLTLAFNPSHLGFVHPVVEGRVRAKQDRRADVAHQQVAPLVIHGEAAFSGQGLIAETLNLAGLPAYTTGGTIHLIVNNQIGYTTLPEQGRSTAYCTAQAQMMDIPIFHVNGDDVEAAVHVMRIATEYRQKFGTDVVIDLVCYRKYGHNEADEPAFTQPIMYDVIRHHTSVGELYGQALAPYLAADENDALRTAATARFAAAHAKSRELRVVRDPSTLLGLWQKYSGGKDNATPQADTGVPAQRLRPLLQRLTTVPAGFTLHPNIMKGLIAKREAMLRDEEPLDWSAGENLAYATLLTEGFRVRLTGQDSERGTFAHRHAVLHDQVTGREAFPLGDIGPGVAMVANSPLSEMACLGFEYGYSLDYPDALVVWEAQFGDFANNAQVMIDQFIASGEDKWKRLSGLVLLLPHGYEGAGPDHSSARLERYLQLCAEDNLQVCYPTNAAQMFHLLRRQMLRPIRKPLVVMTPKSLLRMKEAASSWKDFETGTFQRVLADPQATPKAVKRLLLCSGKVYFDLRKALAADLAIARVEQLYPFPWPEFDLLVASLPSVTEVRWVQEEPQNAGAWQFIHETLREKLAARNVKLTYAGRPESASPATGYFATHQFEQKLLVDEAMKGVTNVG